MINLLSWINQIDKIKLVLPFNSKIILTTWIDIWPAKFILFCWYLRILVKHGSSINLTIYECISD